LALLLLLWALIAERVASSSLSAPTTAHGSGDNVMEVPLAEMPWLPEQNAPAKNDDETSSLPPEQKEPSIATTVLPKSTFWNGLLSSKKKLPTLSTNDNNVSCEHREAIVSPTTTQHISHDTVISSTKTCFVAENDIAELSLHDLGQVLRFAASGLDEGRSNGDGASETAPFCPNTFLKEQPPHLRKVLVAMQEAVQVSQGFSMDCTGEPASPLSSEPQVNNNTIGGTVNALWFAAAMRIFAEWRLLRLIPPQHAGGRYALGMKLGYQDILQNVAKIEVAVHEWIDQHHRDRIQLGSPTIAELMHYEASSGYHPNLPQLTDKRGATGLLWVRRQLSYQTTVFENLMHMRNSNDIDNIMSMSDQNQQQQQPKLAMPLFATAKDAVADAYRQVYDNYHGWAIRKMFHYSFQGAPDTQTIYHHMTSPSQEKDDLGRYCCHQDLPLDHAHPRSFLNIARPLLNDLARAFDHFQMNDPSRV